MYHYHGGLKLVSKSTEAKGTNKTMDTNSRLHPTLATALLFHAQGTLANIRSKHVITL